MSCSGYRLARRARASWPGQDPVGKLPGHVGLRHLRILVRQRTLEPDDVDAKNAFAVQRREVPLVQKAQRAVDLDRFDLEISGIKERLCRLPDAENTPAITMPPATIYRKAGVAKNTNGFPPLLPEVLDLLLFTIRQSGQLQTQPVKIYSHDPGGFRKQAR